VRHVIIASSRSSSTRTELFSRPRGLETALEEIIGRRGAKNRTQLSAQAHRLAENTSSCFYLRAQFRLDREDVITETPAGHPNLVRPVYPRRGRRVNGLSFTSPAGGAICASHITQTPSDANGGLYSPSGSAASAASPARNGTSKSTAGGPIAEGGDDVARFVDGRRSGGGGQRSILQSGAGPKRRTDQSQKSDEKWSHRRNDDDLTNEENLHFQPLGFSVSTASRQWYQYLMNHRIPGQFGNSPGTRPAYPAMISCCRADGIGNWTPCAPGSVVLSKIELRWGGQRTRPLSTAVLALASATGTWRVVDRR
jgi:hypothetical protein